MVTQQTIQFNAEAERESLTNLEKKILMGYKCPTPIGMASAPTQSSEDTKLGQVMFAHTNISADISPFDIKEGMTEKDKASSLVKRLRQRIKQAEAYASKERANSNQTGQFAAARIHYMEKYLGVIATKIENGTGLANLDSTINQANKATKSAKAAYKHPAKKR